MLSSNLINTVKLWHNALGWEKSSDPSTLSMVKLLRVGAQHHYGRLYTAIFRFLGDYSPNLQLLATV